MQRKKQQSENIIIRCYGKEEVWKSRAMAIDFYTEALSCSDGSEQERYANILADLHAGLHYCIDDEYE